MTPVQEYMVELNRQIERAFTPPCAMPPEALDEFRRRAWRSTEVIRRELYRMTMTQVLPMCFEPLHMIVKRPDAMRA